MPFQGGYEISPPPGTKSDPLITPHSSPHGTKEEFKNPAQFSEPCQDNGIPPDNAPPKKAGKITQKPAVLRQDVKVTKSRLVGRMKGLYETTVSRDVIRALIDEILTIVTRAQALELIEEQEKKQGGDLIWKYSHTQRWKNSAQQKAGEKNVG